jgi:membrane fusion protein (multidrug efflux system)
MFVRFFLMLIVVSISLGGLFYWKMEQDKATKAAQAARKMPPFNVETELAQAESWQNSLKAIGTLVAVNGIELKTETEGRVIKLAFESGTEVKKGALLLQLDASEEQAELEALQAQLKLARLDYQRDRKLIKQNSVAQSTLDKSRAQLEKAQADIARIKAVIAKKTLYAPFTGRIGLRQIDLGEYVQKSQSIASLQSMNPLYVNIALPEKHLPHLYVDQSAEVYLDALPDKVLQAKINAIDAEVSPNSRNILAQATLDNPQQQLVPGMFAKVRVLLKQQDDVVSVPETAVSYSLYGNSVFVVESAEGDEAAQQVKRRYVKLGRSENGRVAILDGVKAGEQVVSAGGLKLRDGANVTVKNTEVDAKEQG